MTQHTHFTISPRWLRHHPFFAMVLALACGACGSSPIAPTPLPLPQDSARTPAPTPTTIRTARAALAIESFELRLERESGSTTTQAAHYLYLPSLTLHETVGTSAVTLNTIVFLLPNGDSVIIGGSCLPGPTGRIEAGGTWNSALISPYCLDVDSRTDLVGAEVRVVAIFRDAQGDAGQVTGTTIITTAPPAVRP